MPLVVRLEGTNVELGKKILAESGLPIVSANDLADAAQKIVKAVKGQMMQRAAALHRACSFALALRCLRRPRHGTD